MILIALLVATPTRAGTLLLEIWVNGRNSHAVARVVEQERKLAVRNSDLADAGISAPRDGTALLDRNTPIRAEVDAAGQRLLVVVDPASLALRSADLRPSIVDDVTPAARGAMFGYDLSATANDVSHIRTASSAGGTLAFTLFSGNARFTATGFEDAGPSTHGARLDTALEFDTPSAPRKLIFGDAISGAPDWGRPVRFGGVQLATDFSQQPGRVTFPLPDYFGLAAVPSTVDVFVGSARVFEEPVDEGPFALLNLPILTGGGSATVVVHDVLGREINQTVSLYTDPTLLADGLTDYSLDSGFLRRQYGVANADYATPLVSATWRHGFAAFTTDLHGEFTRTLAMLGGGAGFNVGSFGLFSADAAFSRNNGDTGVLGSASFDGRIGALLFFSTLAASSGRFADIASLDGEAYPRLRYQLGASAAAGANGSLALSWIGERERGDPTSNLVTASYSLSFGSGLFFGLTGLRDIAAGSSAAELFFSLPLGAAIASGSASFGSGKPSFQAIYGEPVDPDGGFGYRILADSAPRRAEADATWIGQQGEVDGAAALDDGKTALRLDASGGVVLLGGDVFATRTPNGAVALVAAGAPDVRIYRENREVALSGQDGKALLADLNPYAPNRIGVEPRDYPMNAVVAETERIVVPPRGTGVLIDMKPSALHTFVAVIRLGDGKPPPIGARVNVDELSAALMVGRDGEVFVGNLSAPADAQIEMGVQSCRFHIVPPRAQSKVVPRVGPLLCRSSDAS
ncbi:MAG TPA: fimbria/pilus outer membrane usher protein [Rhizomicrobium sp.]